MTVCEAIEVLHDNLLSLPLIFSRFAAVIIIIASCKLIQQSSNDPPPSHARRKILKVCK
jgi:hypothetical protein